MVVFVLGITCIASAEKVKGESQKSTSTIKELQGEISGISKESISIIYNRDLEKGIDYEMLLPIEKGNIQLIHKNSLDELCVGDTVRLQYEEETKEDEEGRKIKRKARVISFIKPKPKEIESIELEPEE